MDGDGRDVTPSVVAGVSGGPDAAAVVRVAAQEAGRRGLPLELVTIVGPGLVPDEVPDEAEGWDGGWMSRGSGPVPAPRAGSQARRALARRRLNDAAATAEAAWPGLPVRARSVAQDELDDPATAATLLPAADLLVVGAQGGRRIPPFGLRSASRLLVRRIPAPVLVVPSAAAGLPEAPVVVGLHGHRDRDVLLTAVAESVLRDAPLVVVLVLDGPVRPEPVAVFGDVSVPSATRLVGVAAGHVASALVRVAESERAQLLVIGTPGPAALAGLAPHSTSRTVVRLSPRPVLLVPAVASARRRPVPA
jgi:nucleotide-binding universal stress UspA family protein